MQFAHSPHILLPPKVFLYFSFLQRLIGGSPQLAVPQSEDSKVSFEENCLPLHIQLTVLQTPGPPRSAINSPTCPLAKASLMLLLQDAS